MKILKFIFILIFFQNNFVINSSAKNLKIYIDPGHGHNEIRNRLFAE